MRRGCLNSLQNADVSCPWRIHVWMKTRCMIHRAAYEYDKVVKINKKSKEPFIHNKTA